MSMNRPVYNGEPFQFRIVSNKIQLEKDIDMNNKKIINLANGINNNDVVNKK